MALQNFPVSFENPTYALLGVGLGVVFVVLFYLSYKRLRIAQKRLEPAKWKIMRRIVRVANVGTKIGMIIALSTLLATPYLPMTIEVPVEEASEEQTAQYAVAVMILLDVSYSMNYSDLKPTRLAVSRSMAQLLVNKMGSKDLLGFVSFAGEVYDTILPTSNKSNVIALVNNQTYHPSTAIGTALQTAIGVLETYEVGKAVVLFSDGKNNFGEKNLTSVAEAAVAMKIPIFTVFAGTYGVGEADPISLREISDKTGGKFYEIRSEEMESLVTEVSEISQDVKVSALKTVFDKITVETRDYETPRVIFSALLVVSLFLIWFTGV